MVTAHSSAMPTSKKRSGYVRAKASRPVPAGMAAVMATMRGSAWASAMRRLENTEVNDGAAPAFLMMAPLWMSNGATPWNTSGFS